MQETNNKSLVAYYSRRGENYLNGDIVNLKVGNTEMIAKKIRKITDSDIFQIDTIKSYSKDYYETTEVSKIEKKSNARPELTAKVENMEDYDVIYLGYPNWWTTMPMAVFTFLESYNFSGKTIIPFCTHEGSGLGTSVRDIKKLCPTANVLEGIAIRGENVDKADAEIQDLIKLSVNLVK